MSLVATILTDDLDAAIQALQAHDVAEVRLDGFWTGPPDEADAAAVLEAITGTTAQVIATLRPKRQGGRFEGPEDVRLSLLVAAARAGCRTLDIEADHADVAKVIGALRKEATLLVSDHGLHDMPSRDDGLIRLQRMQDLATAHEKLAVPCGSYLESLRAIELCHAHAMRGGHPAIAPLGGGAPLRALLAVAGNTLTYGHADGLKPAVAGQPAATDIQQIWDHWGFDSAGPEGWLAVIGDPVEHSLSPRIHNAALRAAGIPWRYGALRVPDSLGAVRLLASTAHRIGLRGISVTAPHKHHAAQVAECDGRATLAGAANCLRFAHGPEATNTDVAAFESLLRPHLGATGSMLVLGAGGAARAALAAAHRLGIEARFSCRDLEAGAKVAADLDAAMVPWAQRHQTADVIVQATPLRDASVIPKTLGDCKAAIELVYAEGPTAFEAAAKRLDLHVVDGRGFLIEQAIEAFAFWTGKRPDRSVMEAAL